MSKKNKKEIFIKEKIIFRKILIILYYCIISYIFFSSLLIECKKRKTESEILPKIHLKVQGSGDIKIFSDDFTTFPQTISFGESFFDSPTTNTFHFSSTEDNITDVTLIWDEPLTSTSKMFKGCGQIIEINFTEFDATQISSMDEMFMNCASLKYLYLYNFKIIKHKVNVKDIFKDCPSLEIIFIKQPNLISAIKEIILAIPSEKLSICLSEYIQDDWITEASFRFNKEGICFNDLEYYLDNDGNEQSIMLFVEERDDPDDSEDEGQQQGSGRDESQQDSDEDEVVKEDGVFKCHMKQNLESSKLCKVCGSNIFENVINSESKIVCYEKRQGYYFVQDELKYEPCYTSCETCDKGGNDTYHNCLKCKSEFIYEYNISENKNCYTTSQEEEDSTPEIKEGIIKETINEFISNLNLTAIDEGKDEEVIKDNLKYVFTSTSNQKNNYDKNNISMDLGQCETDIKNAYNISLNDSLYILQLIKEEKGMKIPKVEYEIYYPLNNDTNNLTKLNLTACEGSKIEISIAVEINDTIDKYNPKSKYYNDICSKATSESNTDITLQDRKQEFVDKNMSLCEENCELIGYNSTNKKAKCSCDVKMELPENYEIKFNKKDFLKSFIDIKNIINISVMKCYEVILNIKDLTKNYGCIIISSIFLLYFVTLHIFGLYSFNKLKKQMKNIYVTLKSSKPPKNNDNIYNPGNKVDNHKIIKKESKKERKKNKRTKKESKESNGKKNKLKENNTDVNSQNARDKSTQRMRTIGFSEIAQENKNKKEKDKTLKLKDFELNSLEYEDALILDKRNFFQYYFSLLKNNHPITFSFVPYNDYNSQIIKSFLFFYSFALDFTINTLFFNDDTMHKIYEDKGKFNFLYQIPQILYSTFISKIIDMVIRPLALSQENISDLKQEYNKKNLDIKYKRLIRAIKIKFALFFVVSFFIFIFFWYYITCFCGVYVNTQMHLIKDSLLSFVTGMLYPLGMYLVPGIFRIAALRAEKGNRKCLYKFSSFVESYLC